MPIRFYENQSQEQNENLNLENLRKTLLIKALNKSGKTGGHVIAANKLGVSQRTVTRLKYIYNIVWDNQKKEWNENG